MDEQGREKKLTDLKIEDFIFLVGIVTSLLGLSSNLIEEDCLKKNSQENMRLVKNIRLTTIYIGLVISLYFFLKSHHNLKENAYNPNIQKAINARIKFVTTSLFLIASLLLLYLEEHSTKNESDLIV